mmetsp:Transcript_42688/g.118834  ORF Transcript_42688/g.118834 Transcript_42688/m.118834 type:complete len:327 (-) Transcript_42688:93-1073(-)
MSANSEARLAGLVIAQPATAARSVGCGHQMAPVHERPEVASCRAAAPSRRYRIGGARRVGALPCAALPAEPQDLRTASLRGQADAGGPPAARVHGLRLRPRRLSVLRSPVHFTHRRQRAGAGHRQRHQLCRPASVPDARYARGNRRWAWQKWHKLQRAASATALAAAAAAFAVAAAASPLPTSSAAHLALSQHAGGKRALRSRSAPAPSGAAPCGPLKLGASRWCGSRGSRRTARPRRNRGASRRRRRLCTSPPGEPRCPGGRARRPSARPAQAFAPAVTPGARRHRRKSLRSPPPVAAAEAAGRPKVSSPATAWLLAAHTSPTSS